VIPKKGNPNRVRPPHVFNGNEGEYLGGRRVRDGILLFDGFLLHISASFQLKAFAPLEGKSTEHELVKA
jgi:hypothetical protein